MFSIFTSKHTTFKRIFTKIKRKTMPVIGVESENAINFFPIPNQIQTFPTFRVIVFFSIVKITPSGILQYFFFFHHRKKLTNVIRKIVFFFVRIIRFLD